MSKEHTPEDCEHKFVLKRNDSFYRDAEEYYRNQSPPPRPPWPMEHFKAGAISQNNKVIEKALAEIREKANLCSDATKETRARKGAYVDCVVFLSSLKITDK